MKKICFSILMMTISVLSFASLKKEKPNVIILLVDDLGWKDAGFTGSKFYETPQIDKLASQGIIFTNAYAACAVCSPTRASIQTGRYPARIGITDWIRARFQVGDAELKSPPPYQENNNHLLSTPSNPYWMNLDEVTLAEVFRKAGYFTCHIGKWHLGPDDYYPEKQGYDLNIGGNDMGQPVNYFDPFINSKGVGFPNLQSRNKGEYLTDRLGDELVRVVKEHKNEPFFINMCFYAVHVPLMAKSNLVEKYEAKKRVDEQTNATYAAMIESIDNAVGKLISELKQNKLLDNTLILFFSDNGGLLKRATSNKPLRAGKGYPYEGGIREPMFIYWKNRIEPGTISNLPVSSVDFLPTFCSIIDTPLPDRVIDGRDISPALRGEKMEIVPLYWHYPHYRDGGDMVLGSEVPYSIIRDGNWKLIKRYEGKEFELFNLKDDLGEQKDCARQNPEHVQILNQKLENWLHETNAKLPKIREK